MFLVKQTLETHFCWDEMFCFCFDTNSVFSKIETLFWNGWSKLNLKLMFPWSHFSLMKYPIEIYLTVFSYHLGKCPPAIHISHTSRWQMFSTVLELNSRFAFLFFSAENKTFFFLQIQILMKLYNVLSTASSSQGWPTVTLGGVSSAQSSWESLKKRWR